MTDPAAGSRANLSGPASDVVRAVWAEVLGAEPLEPDVGFFDLGGTSEDVLVVVNRLRGRWPGLRIVDAFLHPTVASMAAFLEGESTAR